MFNRDNKNRLIAEFTHSGKVAFNKETTGDVSVFFIAPKQLTDSERTLIEKSGVPDFPNSSLLTFKPKTQNNGIKASKDILDTFIDRIAFFKKFIIKVKPFSHVHLFYLRSISMWYMIFPLVLLSRFYSKKIILELSNFEDFYQPEEAGVIVGWLYNLVDVLIVPTESQRRTVSKKKREVFYLHKYINIDTEQYRIVDTIQPKILAVAHLEEIFNFTCLKKAFQIVKQKYPRAELVISGDGSMKQDLRNQLDHVKTPGITIEDHNADPMTDFDIFVNCYHVEYFSPALIEAMAAGVPVISSPVAMVDNLIMRKNILLFQFNDASTLADHLIELIEQPETTRVLSENSRQFALEYLSKYDLKKQIEFYRSIN